MWGTPRDGSVTASTWTLVTTTQVSNVAAGRGRARVGGAALSVTIWVTDVDAWLAGAGTTLAGRVPAGGGQRTPPVLVAAVSVPAPPSPGLMSPSPQRFWPRV